MNLSGLLSALRALPEYRSALDSLAGKKRHGFALTLGVPRAARIPVTAALAEDAQRPVLVVAARIDRALTFAEELNAWNPALPVLQFNEPTPLFYEYDAWDARTIRARISALAALTHPQLPISNLQSPIIITSARALMTRTLPKRDFLANTRALKVGQTVRLEKMIEAWVGAGYAAETIVVEPGQFARRGGIIDIFPMADELPARLELFGDDVETIRRFDPATQRSGEAIEFLTITPAREALPKYAKAEGGRMKAENDSDSSFILHPSSFLEFQLPLMFPPASLLEYLPEKALVLVDDWQELSDTIGEFEEQAVQLRSEQLEAGLIDEDYPLPYHTWAELQDELSEREPIFLAARTDEEVPSIHLGSRFHPGPRYGGQLKPLLDHLRDLQAGLDRAVVVTRQSQRLAELWGEHYNYIAPTDSLSTPSADGSLAFVQGALSEGWILKGEGEGMKAEASSSLHLLTDSEIFGWARPEPRRRHARQTAVAPESNYADFAPGDFVVHADFGIGRFRELVKRALDALEREYLLLEYAEGDELYVPIHQTDRLTRYVGADDHPPTLSRLGSAEWQTIKSRTQQAVEEIAKEMLELYARRELAPGRAFSADTPWQAELEASFPYVETEDQLRAIHEVKADMEHPRPMDRLICGDVGYGKTEVALRAAFKAVTDGAQVAILVPTTILAQQHLHTFQSRLSPYPVKVEMLSRFRSPAEAKRIVEQMAEGAVDIVIGTHRLLQKDVLFKNLGLLIIDEEQRFGVTHKERLKQMRTEVDVLTLTATPIPRTLYMSLTGVRDISTINTPPEERLPIVTHSAPYNERLVRQAILRELDRGGQVFFVHNRVQSISIVRHKLAHLIPEARLGVGHGQMDEHELSQVMDQFTNGEIDILLCTSIIESGLDIPNANTLIVDRADTFGLAQLYQLRGRVGRGAAQAYAYFFTDHHHRPTLEARERLDTIAEQTELGAGYSIAMRDLEMRGAGDLLGSRQSGHISAVGFHLYTRLLAQAVKRLKMQDSNSKIQTGKAPLNLESWNFGISVSVDLPLAASIPSDYVADRALRLQLYRRLANLTEENDVAAMGAELADRFGPLPRPVENLLFQLRVKIRAARAGISTVASEGGQIVLILPQREDGDYGGSAANLGRGVRMSKNKIWLPPPKGDLRPSKGDLRRATGEREKDWREQLLNLLAQLASERGPL